MKVAFWSSARGSIGVTSNLACVSIAMAFENVGRTVLMENHYQKRPLENMLIHRKENIRRQNIVLEKDKIILGNFSNIARYKGLEHIINQLSKKQYKYAEDYQAITGNIIKEEEYWTLKDSSGKKQKYINEYCDNLFREASFEILINSLYYIPIGNHFNEFIFDYILNDYIMNVLQASEKFAGYTLIDTSNTNYLSSKIILDEADLVMVNLSQDQELIDRFFRDYSSLLSKSIILLNGLNNDSCNSYRILQKYSFNMNKVIRIPCNQDYRQAVEHGTIVEFMTRNYECREDNPNYSFIMGVKQAVYAIQNELSNE